MSTFSEQVILGKTGLKVGRLGIASSYGAPAEAYEMAFERGCNYFVLGSFMKGRSKEMIRAVRNIIKKGGRENLVIGMMEYTHSKVIGRAQFKKGLRQLDLDYIDVLVLGYYMRLRRKQVFDLATGLKEKGLVRYLGLAGHNRELFPKLRDEGELDIFHVRYNAVNNGAEKDVFPFMGGENRPGMVTYTATRWGQLLKESKMPPGEKALTAKDCYRFVLSNPSVDICMTGTRNMEMMEENLETLESGPLSPEEMERIRRIGDHVYGKPRE
jgi:aryl-alcohol dehydrogenase-like predicted oxidoreductase